MIAEKVKNVEVPKFEPRSGIIIEVSDAEAALRSHSTTSDSKLDELKKFIPRGGALALIWGVFWLRHFVQFCIVHTERARERLA